jgi:hypothetical protein
LGHFCELCDAAACLESMFGGFLCFVYWTGEVDIELSWDT